MSCSRSLSSNHAAGDTGFDSVAKHTEIFGAANVHAPQLVAAMCHWMTAYRDTCSGVVGNHTLLWIHCLQGRGLLLILIERFQERSCLPCRSLDLPERIATMRPFANRVKRTNLGKSGEVSAGERRNGSPRLVVCMAALYIDCPVREPIQPAPHPRTPAPKSAPKRPGMASWKRPDIIRMPAKIKPPKQMTAPA